MKKLLIFICLQLAWLSTFGQGFEIDTMKVTVKVLDNGTAQINEDITANFTEEKHGIYRDIPYVFEINKTKYKTPISDIVVTGHQFKQKKRNGAIQLRIGDPDKKITGTQNYIIGYTVSGPYFIGDTFEEFYWNLTGNDWKAKINKVTFEVLFPSSVTLSADDIKVFSGREGSNSSANINYQIEGNAITGSVNKVLESGEGATISVRLPKGFVPTSKAVDMQTEINAEKMKSSPWWYAVPVSLFLAFLGWWRGIRGQKTEIPIIPITYPPGELSPAEVGTFIDDIAHDRDILSLIPYWGYQGYLTITKTGDDMMFTKLKDLDGQRPQYELSFFKAIFTTGNQAYLSDINKNMYSIFQSTKSAVKDDLYKAKLYDERYLHWFRSWRVVLPILGFVVLCIVSFLYINVVIGALFAIAALFSLAIAFFPPSPSPKGEILRAKLKGLKAHLEEADANQIASIMDRDKTYLERMFPYAFALGIDKSWTTKVSQHSNIGPSWYYMGAIPGTMDSFSAEFTPKVLSSAFIQYPDMGSGSSGGGFSGGGFGGGGGGSW